jgi:hypothetical protein
MSRCVRECVVAAGVVLLSLAHAGAGWAAQPGSVHREGWTIGLSLGAGSLRLPTGWSVTCEYTYVDGQRLTVSCLDPSPDYESKAGLGAGFQVGRMISDRAAVLLDSTGLVAGVNGGYYSSTVHTVALQYWVGEQIWLKAGVGIGLWVEEASVTDTGLGFMVAIGKETRQRRHSATDVSLRFATVAIDFARVNQISVNLGFSWY